MHLRLTPFVLVTLQVVMSCLLNPPRPGDQSYELFVSEKEAELASLRRRAAMVSNAFARLPGMSVVPTRGAMYAFPRLELPMGALAAAAAAGKKPDVFYCLELLQSKGIAAVPGSGFGQQEGTAHFRTTILPREERMTDVVQMFAEVRCRNHLPWPHCLGGGYMGVVVDRVGG
jgi:aspartate/methionine/tyrosine aminotransferase